MSTGPKMPLQDAENIADELRWMLIDACDNIVVAGSIRRQKDEVGDGEIVAIPLIDGFTNRLHERLDELVKDGDIEKALVTDVNGKVAPRWGDKHRKVKYRGLTVDIFMTDAYSWGYQLLIRTGPAAANEYLFGQIKKSAPFRLAGGDVFKKETRLAIQSEADFFTLCGFPWIEPHDRSEDSYRKLLFAKGHKWGDPSDYIPQQIRLLWNYNMETLGAFPIPLDFRDEATGKTWANLTTDRFGGEYQLVKKGSREERFQHEFLVGAVQRRFEENRLRKWLWRDQTIDVPGVNPIHDRLRLRPLDEMEACPTETVSLDLIVPTQMQVFRWGVYEKTQELDMQQRYPSYGAFASCVGVRFEGDDKIYLFDGHHRYMALREKRREEMSVIIHDMPYTLESFMNEEVGDNIDYDFLADVMAEAYDVLAEGILA